MLALSLGLTAKLRASRPDALITGGILGIRRKPMEGRAASTSMTGSTGLIKMPASYEGQLDEPDCPSQRRMLPIVRSRID
jgi:hypothetical protein